MKQLAVSSLHAIWGPLLQFPWRRYRTVSYAVAAPSQVWIVATPDVAGVHRNTRSGAPALLAQVPASVLAPLVVPLKVPPAAGMSVAFWQTGSGVAVAVTVGVGVRVGVGVAVGSVPFGAVTARRNVPALVA